jgi:hypothetical protein
MIDLKHTDSAWFSNGIFIHLFDSGILLIIDLKKKKRKKGRVNFTVK